MRAVVFDLSLPRYLAAKALGRQLPSLYWGAWSCLSLRELPAPALRGPDWVKLRVEAAGFCGSDLATVLLKMSPALSPFSSFPAVLGHEVVGRVVEAGAGARADGFREGDRVALDPAFGCRVRGLPHDCAACARGRPASCDHAGTGDGGLAAGFSLGYHRDLPGGFADYLVAHRSQLHRLPERLPLERAVLTEPLAIGLHAVLQREPRAGESVLIIGGGMIAYAVLAALRLGAPGCHVTQLVLLPHQAELGRALGADHVLDASALAGDALVDAVATLTGARRHRPLLGRAVLRGGFDVTYDCVGSRASLVDALAFTRSQGTLVMVGGCGTLPRLDLSSLWAKELELRGTFYYAPEAARGGRHTMDLVIDLLGEEAARPLDALVTHSFALERYREAIVANIDRGRHRSVKTIFRPELSA